MAKLFYLPESQARGLHPQNEDAWFKDNQALLLQAANTDYGRELLHLPDRQSFPVIDQFSKRHIRGRVGDHAYISEFHSGAKWGNVIRYLFKEWTEYANFLLAKDFRMQNALEAVAIWYGGKFRLAPSGATVTTVYPDAHVESSTVDGRVRRSSVSETWATIRAAAGNASGDSGTDGGGAQIQSAATTDRWQFLERFICLFDTSPIADAHAISGATLSTYGRVKENSIGNAINMNVYLSSPASDTALIDADFTTLGTTAQATAISYASYNTGAYNAFTLNATGLGNISKTGISKFGFRNETYDAGGSTATWASGAAYDALVGYEADYTGTSRDPKLVVTHAPGFRPTGALIF
jgi:hypothetical protein